MAMDPECCVLQDSERDSEYDWFAPAIVPHWHGKGFDEVLAEMWEFPDAAVAVPIAEPSLAAEVRFRELAARWSAETGHISSIDNLVAHPSYQEIIRLGWDVVPYLLADLQKSKRFWFPALAAITTIRPFDPGDAGNNRRMTDAWLKWGKRKGLI